MGRDWSWIGGGGSSGRSSKSKKGAKTAASSGSGLIDDNNRAISGCMSAVRHMFDLHHFLQFPLNTNHSSSSSASSSSISNTNGLLSYQIPPLKGVEAPRNSLESVDGALVSPTKKEESLNFSKIQKRMNIKKIATKDQRSKLEALNSSDSCSPSVKTPSLVARLMGLDLLPENSSSSSCSSPSLDFRTPDVRTRNHNRSKKYSLHRNSVDGVMTGSLSLPETPRISLARRSDVENHCQHRLSLHLNRESLSKAEPAIARLRKTDLKSEGNENLSPMSPREYAKQIVKQVRESVSRRVGSDITNTVKNRDRERNQSNHHTPKSKNSKISTSESPRLGFSENFNAKSVSPRTNLQKITVIQTEEPKQRLLQTVKDESRQEQVPEKDCRDRKSVKKGMKFCPRMVKPPQIVQEEPFVRALTQNRACNNSNQIRDNCKKIFPFRSPLPLKKDLNLSLPIPKQVTEAQAPRSVESQLPSCSSQSYAHIVQENDKTTTSTQHSIAAAEKEFITSILKRTGLDKHTPISYAKWFSPSHPLDPSIFYYLEHYTMISGGRNKTLSGNVTLRSNRKLLFHLIDEILVGVLKPRMNLKPWVCKFPIDQSRDCNGWELINELCDKIEKYPSADCRVLDDIDALIEKDLPEIKRDQREGAFEEEGENIAAEIEKDILESLLVETASFL